jgi:hypothetical protein
MSRIKTLRILGSMTAGVVGFTLGFYAGVFVAISVFGLDAVGSWYPTLTTGLGSLFAGIAIALTVKSARRWAALVTAIALGAMLVMVVVAVDAHIAVMMVGGLILVAITVAITRSGSGSTLFT